MSLQFSTGLAVANLDAWFNGGTAQTFLDSAILRIRSGSPPATADTAPSGTVLAEMTLPADAMAGASGHSTVKSGTWSDSAADAPGTGAHFEIVRSGDLGTTNTTDKRIRGTVTATSGGGDMELDNVSIAIGQVVTVTTFTLSLPA